MVNFNPGFRDQVAQETGFDFAFKSANAGATPTPDRVNGPNQVFTLTADATVGAPPNAPPAGLELFLVFLQDATGGHALAWNAAWRDAPALSAGTAGQRASFKFRFDGASWQFINGSTAFA